MQVLTGLILKLAWCFALEDIGNEQYDLLRADLHMLLGLSCDCSKVPYQCDTVPAVIANGVSILMPRSIDGLLPTTTVQVLTWWYMK